MSTRRPCPRARRGEHRRAALDVFEEPPPPPPPSPPDPGDPPAPPPPAGPLQLDNGEGGEKLTIFDVQAKVAAGEKVFQVSDRLPDGAARGPSRIDFILIGDSLGMTALGYPSTVPVTMDEMIHHAKAISRAAKRSILVGDLPLGAYHASTADAVTSAMRMVKEGGADVVKMEGGEDVVPMIEAVVKAGIPVMGHMGLTPQLISKLGGWRVQGKSAAAGAQLVRDADALERAGCFAVVLEAIPDRVATLITERLQIPTIGIGAGPGCDGQNLVLHDLVGLFDRFLPASPSAT